MNVAEITQNFKAGLSTVPTEPTTAVTVAWEANSPEDNVKGYKIYYGPQSRFDSSLDPAAILAEAQKDSSKKGLIGCHACRGRRAAFQRLGRSRSSVLMGQAGMRVSVGGPEGVI